MLKKYVQKAVSSLDYTKHMYKKCPRPKSIGQGFCFLALRWNKNNEIIVFISLRPAGKLV